MTVSGDVTAHVTALFGPVRGNSRADTGAGFTAVPSAGVWPHRVPPNAVLWLCSDGCAQSKLSSRGILRVALTAAAAVDPTAVVSSSGCSLRRLAGLPTHARFLPPSAACAGDMSAGMGSNDGPAGLIELYKAAVFVRNSKSSSHRSH